VDVVWIVGSLLVGADVRVVDERHTVGGEHQCELLQIAGDDVTLGVHQRVEAEDQVDRSVRSDRQRRAVVDVEGDMHVAGEALAAVSDRGLGDVHPAGTNPWMRENSVTHH